jgi:hypothetical protein
MRSKLRLLGVLIMGLILVGCSRQRDQQQQAQQTGPSKQSKPAQPPPPTGFEVGNLAHEIEGEDIDGKKFKLSDYRGKVVLLDFWASW